MSKGEKKTLVLHVFSGEGVQTDDLQSILTNEYDEKSRYYKQFPAERCVKDLAASHPNSYHVAVFACNRELSQAQY